MDQDQGSIDLLQQALLGPGGMPGGGGGGEEGGAGAGEGHGGGRGAVEELQQLRSEVAELKQLILSGLAAAGVPGAGQQG